MKGFIRQLASLIYKNLLVSIARRPLGFLLSVYGFPLAILGLLLAIPSFLPQLNTFGVSTAEPIKPLASTVTRKLVIVKRPDLGHDVDAVIRTFTQPVQRDLLVFHDDEASLSSVCLPDTRGVSDCHAIVIFKDSPLTTSEARLANPPNGNHTWTYTIQADPARDNRNFDIKKHKSDQEDLYMPLQLAINNAITNSTIVPETVMFTPQEEANEDQKNFNSNAALIGRIYTFALIAAHFTIIYGLASFITSERESGMSQLIDSMGGGTAIIARVLSWLLTLDLVALPCYIAMGALYQRLAFPSSSAGTLIGWQILLGFAVNSSTAFASAFFSKSRVSAVYIIFVFLVLSIAAQMYASESRPHPQHATVAALSFLFPSANSVYFTQQMALWQLAGLAADLGKMPVETAGLFSTSYAVSQSNLLLFLGLSVFIYAAAAVGVEKMLHGIHYRKRRFTPRPSMDATGAVVQTRDLKKRFKPSLWSRICCCCCFCGRKKTVAAVDGISFEAQRGQIMCLVGPNGSGKTTTLHIMSGFINPTEGSVALEAAPSQVGICPQRNTLWDNLTVGEHVRIWNGIKSGSRSSEELEQLIGQCDLSPKRGFKARELSGGQKRKLQLACMFVGDSSVCLIDECTSGLDPLSRRAIWEILLQQRARRSIIFTTHFLDEVDILADHIVLLAGGKIKCQGAPAQLKSQHGGGYKVLVPPSAPDLGHGYPPSTHQDRTMYAVPDSAAASRLISMYLGAGVRDVSISGPQFEDVFLNLLQDDVVLDPSKSLANVDPYFSMSPGTTTSSWTQFRVLYGKRWNVLTRFWSPYLFAVIVPLAVTFLAGGIIKDYSPPGCDALQDTFRMDYAGLKWNESCPQSETCDRLSISPSQANATLFSLVRNGYRELSNVSAKAYSEFVDVQTSRDDVLKHIEQNKTAAGYGGIFAGTSTEAPMIAYRILTFGDQSGSQLLDIWSQMQGGLEINSSQESMPKTRRVADVGGIAYLLFFTFVQIFYPASFVLYPAIEKSRKVRAVQYANGVRRAPLWAAYAAFDFLWVLIVAVGVMGLSALKLKFNGPMLILLPTLALYGVAATLMGYVVAHFTDGPLKSYLATLGIGFLSWIVVAIATLVNDSPSSLTAIAFGADLFLPIGNIFRTLLVGLNLKEAGCKDGRPVEVGTIYSFGGPLLYLFLQIFALLIIITWLEGGFPSLGSWRYSRVSNPHRFSDVELADISAYEAQLGSDPVSEEASRAERTETDLLRVLHASKHFGSNKAVDDVTFGLPRSDVMALLGPNGAGKSTLVNMIQGEFSPSQGKMLLCQEDSRSPSSKKHLGVCPQYDAPDLMNTRDHLYFYGRIKGIQKVKENVEYLMAKLDLTRHARTQASKLSGGNKRKLMLALALMGTPSILVLDEPTSAMDAVAKRQFWKVIQEIARDRSVLLTTHSMEEADALCTRTVIMARRILAIGTTQALRQRYNNEYFVNLVLGSAPKSTAAEMGQVTEWVRRTAPDARFEREVLGGQVRFTLPTAVNNAGSTGGLPIARLMEALEQSKRALGIEHYSVSGPTLEDVFLSVVRENNVEEENGVEKKRGLLDVSRVRVRFPGKGRAWCRL
ncbi:hypothetical protein MHUMG1_01000 [Metarhizium humberi]|uniref:ABC transporter domain-containing protein n=1 Tax=Metarhizium humberi TaxID=2596975 RepID=A0A9P8MKJ0_9HYPO|nr:hypothetical protein MHUMG1_01000 [Metarhizium humberi]